MAFHPLHKRCDECGAIYSVRMPQRTVLVPAVVAAIQCPTCHPEALGGVCGGCRIPLAISRNPKRYGKSGFPLDLCLACYQRERRARARYKASITVTVIA